MISLSVWEANKENVQPLREGRDPNVLAETFSDPSHLNGNKKQQQLESMRKYENINYAIIFSLRNFEDQIGKLGDKGSDPLALWVKYVNWTKQNYPSETLKQNIFSIVERCVRLFISDLRYKNDIRYLSLWVTYVCAFDLI
jgi:hypothetical protein